MRQSQMQKKSKLQNTKGNVVSFSANNEYVSGNMFTRFSGLPGSKET